MQTTDRTMPMLRTLWHDKFSTPRYAALTTSIEVDVAIVGAGITGLTLAWQLKGSGLRVAVLEAREVGSGTTGSATGNLYVPVEPGLSRIAHKHGRRALQTVAALRAEAIGGIARLIADNHIECGFQRVPFHLFSLPHSGNSQRVHEEYTAAERAGLSPSKAMPDDFPFSADALCTLDGQAQFDPLRYVSALAALLEGDDCHIFEHSQVLEMSDDAPCLLRTAGGRVRARHLVKATHTPQGRYYVHAAMVPRREYALLARLGTRAPPAAIYWSACRDGQYSLRPWHDSQHDYLLLLGQPHEPGGQKCEHLKMLENFIRARFDVIGIDYIWCAQNYQSADHLPYIGLSPGEPHTWIATGFAADGLVWGTVAGRLLGAAILEREDPRAKLFSPRRFKPLASLGLLVKESGAVGRHLFKDHILPTRSGTVDEVLPGEGRVMKLQGERVAVYRDDDGHVELVCAICPHLGCLVHWNALEKSWDCPCHGSRFATDGTLLEGPAPSGLAPCPGSSSEGPAGG